MEKDLSKMTLEELWELFPIVLKEHNPAYTEQYHKEKEKIIKNVGDIHIERISHIGSTVVKDLVSKPIVDILLEIDRECNIDKLKERLTNSGWLLMAIKKKPEISMVFNKGYTPSGFAAEIYHLHVRYYADWGDLYFRDYLIKHKDIADEYGKLKLSLLKKYKHNRDGYTEQKTQFIQKYTEKARKELEGKYLP